ncbi:isochorismatase family protein [Streptomyces sp. NPDC052301]|uniref:isochorismatase family protein n=1 Tax=Streptomyces sp. NPDC052301 TaxID=3365687 RepID=UPI0037CE4914
MDISAIAAYPMPGPCAPVENRVGWTPDAQRAVLLVMTMQHYFLRPYPRDASPRDGLLANSAALIRTCRELRVPVVHTVQPGTQAPGERGLLTDFWGKGLDDALDDVAIVDEVAPDASGAVLSTWRYSAFHGTDLERRLRSLGRDQLVICGVYAHLGCTTTAVDAFSRNVEAFLAADAVAGFSAHQHRAALDWAAGCCAAVRHTRELTEALRASAGRPPTGDPGA